MIVHSNAFVYSTCLLVIVFRYGYYKKQYLYLYNIDTITLFMFLTRKVNKTKILNIIVSKTFIC